VIHLEIATKAKHARYAPGILRNLATRPAIKAVAAAFDMTTEQATARLQAVQWNL